MINLRIAFKWQVDQIITVSYLIDTTIKKLPYLVKILRSLKNDRQGSILSKSIHSPD